MNRIFRTVAMLIAAWCAAAAAQPALAQAAPDAAGAWHGVLTTPNGSLRLIITVSRTPDGALKADLESPDQAPGQKIPATRITAQGDTLGFEVLPLSVSYTGKWVAAEQGWQGTFVQGVEMPLKLSAGRGDAAN